jgi:hypothetical protein
MTRTIRNRRSVAKLAKSFGGIGIGAQLAETLGEFRYDALRLLAILRKSPLPTA